MTVNLHTVSGFKEIKVGKGVILRPLDQSHANRILEILNTDKSIRNKVTVASRLYTPEDVAVEIKRYHKDPGLIRYVMLRKNDPIGFVSFWRDDGFFGTAPNPDDYGFGYFLDPKERGKGLVTRALQALMKTTVDKLKVRQFAAFCADDNHESMTVLTKLGFKPTKQTFKEPEHGWIERKYVLPSGQRN